MGRADDGLAGLPEMYAAVLRLHGDGLSERAIAATLGLEVEAVRPLLLIATSKLERLRLDASADPQQSA